MRIFSKHRKKLEPKRRFGSREFRSKVQDNANYKRVFSGQQPSKWDKFFRKIGFTSRFWRRAGYAVLILLFYFLVVSSDLVVDEFSISGNNQVSSQQIQDVLHNEGDKRIFLVKKANFLLLTHNRINEMLTKNIPTIKEVSEYRRIWPNKAELTIKERTAGFVLKSLDKYYLVDDEGIVVKSTADNQNLLVVEDTVEESFATGEALPNPKLAAFIISTNQSWSSKLASTVAGVKFPGKASNEVHFISSEGWVVFFDINRSAISQLTDLALILNREIPARDRTRLAYIDLRLNQKAYYCYNESACVQQPLEDENQENAEE